MSEPPVLLSKGHEDTKWVISRVDPFPKNQRFILGQRLVDGVLDIHECLIEGAYSRGAKKRAPLSTANRKIEVLRWLIRLAHERELLTARQFAFSYEQMSDCGRLPGSWIKQSGGTDSTSRHASFKTPLPTAKIVDCSTSWFPGEVVANFAAVAVRSRHPLLPA